MKTASGDKTAQLGRGARTVSATTDAISPRAQLAK